MRVEVDVAVCTGHGRCYSLSPAVYEPDDDGYGSTRSSLVPPGLEDAARTGAQNCPEGAIRLIED